MGTLRLGLRHWIGFLAAVSIGMTAADDAAARCYFLECGDAPNSEPSPPTRTAPRPRPIPVPTESVTPSRTFWNHNGSVMYLVVQGSQRQFYYEQPRQGMIDEGVTSGTLLFSGTVTESSYEGTAFLFSARCGKRAYQVSGPVEENGGRVVMSGAAMSLDGKCRPKRVIQDVLVFDYMYSD